MSNSCCSTCKGIYAFVLAKFISATLSNRIKISATGEPHWPHHP
uniref:Uncharacterized protein n=1 Tax=Rhizophora mucronata TaxID=61149 RepID=A0A2P2MPV9_RHIMU